MARFAQIGSWLREGQIGPLRHVHWSLARRPKPADRDLINNWRVQPDVAGGGYFVDLASHGLDLFIHLAGPITEVSGVRRNQQRLYPAEDAVAAAWGFASGATGSGFWNFASDNSIDQVILYGATGQIEFSIFDDNPIILSRPKGEIRLEIPHPAHIQEPHIAAIARHLAGGERHPSLAADAIAVSRVMDRIIAAEIR